MKNLIGVLLLVLSIGCSNYSEINIFDNYDEGLAYATVQKRNILLIFDSYGNPTNSVKRNIYNNDFKDTLKQLVVIVLYVDGPSENALTNRKRQKKHFDSENQPMYYLLNSEGKIIKDPIGYCNKLEFQEFINLKNLR